MLKTKATFFLVCGALTIGGATACKKQQAKPDDTVTEGTIEPQEDKEWKDKKVAEGDERATLLALQRVHFGVDKFDLTDESRTALTEASAGLKKLPKVHLHVDGHADSTGSTEYNLQLGEKRAKAVKDFLVRAGIEGERLHIISFGEEEPLKDDGTAEALAANRRVDFRLMRGDVEIVLEESATVQ